MIRTILGLPERELVEDTSQDDGNFADVSKPMNFIPKRSPSKNRLSKSQIRCKHPSDNKSSLIFRCM